MALAEDTVREALKQVIDPELYVNIVDLGLIYVVNVGEEDADGKHEVNIANFHLGRNRPGGDAIALDVGKIVLHFRRDAGGDCGGRKGGDC